MFLFNSTNTTDATSSARPNLTNYHAKVDLPDPNFDSNSTISNKNGPQAKKWTVVVPELHVVTGYMQMGILVDGMGY